jgi:hypothetical protein
MAEVKSYLITLTTRNRHLHRYRKIVTIVKYNKRWWLILVEFIAVTLNLIHVCSFQVYYSFVRIRYVFVLNNFHDNSFVMVFRHLFPIYNFTLSELICLLSFIFPRNANNLYRAIAFSLYRFKLETQFRPRHIYTFTPLPRLRIFSAASILVVSPHLNM